MSVEGTILFACLLRIAAETPGANTFQGFYLSKAGQEMSKASLDC